jgi:TfoX/Sxy family transcriptional regulator of competence genes
MAFDPELAERLCFLARLRGASEAPPSLVARSFVAPSSVQAAPRPSGSLRAVLAAAAPVPPTERRMFGGLTFMVGGNMCCGVMGEDLFVRVGEAEASRALAAEPAARPFDMGRGPSASMVLVARAGVATDEALIAWVRKALVFVALLPAR